MRGPFTLGGRRSNGAAGCPAWRGRVKPLKGAQCGPGGQREGTATTGSLPPIPHTEGPGVASYSGPCCAHTRLVSISQAVRCSAASVHAATVATKTRFQKGPEGLGVPLLHLLLAAWNSQDCLVSLFSAGASSGTAGPLDPPPHPTLSSGRDQMQGPGTPRQPTVGRLRRRRRPFLTVRILLRRPNPTKPAWITGAEGALTSRAY